jgi:hypothetical protein
MPFRTGNGHWHDPGNRLPEDRHAWRQLEEQRHDEGTGLVVEQGGIVVREKKLEVLPRLGYGWHQQFYKNLAVFSVL